MKLLILINKINRIKEFRNNKQTNKHYSYYVEPGPKTKHACDVAAATATATNTHPDKRRAHKRDQGLGQVR